MRGLEALAKTCAPQENPEPTKEITATITKDQCELIARQVIAMLQGGLPETKEKEPEQEKSEPEPEQKTEPESGEGEEELDGA